MKRIMVLSCDANFFIHARNLVSSVHERSPDVVDNILFFDLGIDAEQRAALQAMGVQVLVYPRSLSEEIYSDFLAPRMFAWKTYALHEAVNHGDQILYCDCGCIVINSLRPIFNAIQADDIFLIKDPHITGDRTHETCLQLMRAGAAEREAQLIDAGVMGFRVVGRYAPIFHEAFQWARIRACISGDAVMHRHDQSIYSILATRFNAPKISSYGSFVHWKGIETSDQIIWQHRGKWPAFKRLRERASAIPARRRIAVYGAGKHTLRFLPTLRNLLEPRHCIVGIIDDSPKAVVIDELKIVATGEWRVLAPDVVIVSSDAHEAGMMEKGREAFPGVKVWGIYGDE